MSENISVLSTTPKITAPPISSYTPCYARELRFQSLNFIECFLFKFPFILQDIGFGYICIALSLIVIFTTIFGKIKESYKWFILNQAIWDLIVSYDFICARPSASNWVSGLFQSSDGIRWISTSDTVVKTCFYSSSITIERFFNDIVESEAGYMLFLLSFSRFLALYAHNFYERNCTPLKTVVTIVIFDIFFFFSVNLKNTYLAIKQWGDNTSAFLSCLEWIILFLIVPVTIIFIACILLKLYQQLRFQYQHNSKTVRGSSIRIAGVLLFHCITLIALFTFVSVYDFPITIIPLLRRVIEGGALSTRAPDRLIQAFKTNQKCFNVARIFIDSIVILVILSGYRRSILRIFKVFMPWKKTPIEPSTRDTVATRFVHVQRHR